MSTPPPSENDSESAAAREAAEELPSRTAVSLAVLVLVFSVGVIAIAACELSHSAFWQVAPLVLQKVLR